LKDKLRRATREHTPANRHKDQYVCNVRNLEQINGVH
jgi:hypothetical protein